jgi:hypothetical protein
MHAVRFQVNGDATLPVKRLYASKPFVSGVYESEGRQIRFSQAVARH